MQADEAPNSDSDFEDLATDQLPSKSEAPSAAASNSYLGKLRDLGTTATAAASSALSKASNGLPLSSAYSTSLNGDAKRGMAARTIGSSGTTPSLNGSGWTGTVARWPATKQTRKKKLCGRLSTDTRADERGPNRHEIEKARQHWASLPESKRQPLQPRSTGASVSCQEEVDTRTSQNCEQRGWCNILCYEHHCASCKGDATVWEEPSSESRPASTPIRPAKDDAGFELQKAVGA